jgi:D-alanyl-D-alanine carboxypeptidase (penicillin-binding protein 5/6)
VIRPAAGAAPLPPDVSVASYVVADLDTGKILAAKAPHLRLRPASTLKILTADTLIPRLDPAATVDPVPADYQAEPDGSVVGVTTGVTYSVADLWRAAFIVSGNDAVMTLAHLAGGVGHTVALMQAKARTLGAADTVVVNPDGYDADGQVTSAYDLALIARAGLRLTDFRQYCALRQASFPRPNGATSLLVSQDPMLESYPGMIGVKGGITTLAGHTYVGAAQRNGHTLLVTLMLGGTDIWGQTTKLLDWGFAADGNVTPVGTLGTGLTQTGPPAPKPAPAPKTMALLAPPRTWTLAPRGALLAAAPTAPKPPSASSPKSTPTDRNGAPTPPSTARVDPAAYTAPHTDSNPVSWWAGGAGGGALAIAGVAFVLRHRRRSTTRAQSPPQ